MGIAGFQKWLEQHHARCFVKLRQPSNVTPAGYPFDHIYVDLNGYLHTAARKRSSEEDVISCIFFELDKLLKQCIPRKSIFIAVDGPASAAKLITQRQRRLAAVNKQARKKDAPPPKNGKRKRVPFNSLQVTAGTPFMHRLKNAISFWACSRLQSQPKFQNVRIYISGSDVPGEGELKIIEFMVSHANADSAPPQSDEERMFATQAGFAEQERNAETFRSDSHLIVGTDADLVLLGMSCMLQNVFVLHAQQNVSKLFSVWEFCRSLERSIPLKGHCNRTRLDFVFVSLMSGNDYLPKLYGASLDSLWPRYIRMRNEPQYLRQFLVNPGYTLNVPFFLALLCAPLRVQPTDPSPASPPPAALAPFSPLCHATTQAFGSISLQQADFVDPAIISSSVGFFAPHALTGDAALLNDPSIIAASLPITPKQLAHYRQAHLPPPAAGGTMPPALSLIFADPYLSAAAFPSPTATAALPPAFGPSGLAPRASVQINDDEEEEVICFRPAAHARGAAVKEEEAVVLDSMDQDMRLPGEDLIEEAINEESEEEKELARDPKRRRIAPGEENMVDDGEYENEGEDGDFSDEDEDEDDFDDEDDDEEEEEEEEENEVEDINEDGKEEEKEVENEAPALNELKMLKRGSNAGEYLRGLFWCLKTYMEGLCPDNRWFYAYRQGPPGDRLRDYFESKGAVPTFYTVPVPQSSALPLEPHKFCLTVLPLQARDVAHELLQPYMALNSKLGSIFRQPSVMVNIQLIDSVLSEIPENRLPPELRFSHMHYFQRTRGAPYQGRDGHFFLSQREEPIYPEGPSVLSLLPQPVKRYRYNLVEPERWIKCAYYHTRSLPVPSLSPQRHRFVVQWPALDEIDYVALPYYKPLLQSDSRGRGGGMAGARGRGGPPAPSAARAPGAPGGRGGWRGGRGGGPPPAAMVTPQLAPAPAPAPSGAPFLQPGRGRGSDRGGFTGGASRGSDRGGFTRGASRGASRGSDRGGFTGGYARGDAQRGAPSSRPHHAVNMQYSNSYFYDGDSNSTNAASHNRGSRGGKRDGGAPPAAPAPAPPAVAFAASSAPAPATIPERGYRVVFRPKRSEPSAAAAPPSQ